MLFTCLFIGFLYVREIISDNSESLLGYCKFPSVLEECVCVCVYRDILRIYIHNPYVYVCVCVSVDLSYGSRSAVYLSIVFSFL